MQWNYLDILARQIRMGNRIVTSIPFGYLIISWMTNYAYNRSALTCLRIVMNEPVGNDTHQNTKKSAQCHSCYR